MAKNNKQDPEILKQDLVDSNVKDMFKVIERGLIPLNPTRSFEPGERIIFGAHDEVYVREVHSDGLFYICEGIGIKRGRNVPRANEFFVQPWYDIYKYNQERKTEFTKKEKYYIRQLNSGIESLLHLVYAPHAGVDFDVEYQREHVWELEDKVDLIDSIYNNVDIGKFVFVQNSIKTEGRYYQVLDGKQRLTALCEFYEDRFPYKGVYFSEMSRRDKHTFRDHGITYGYLENPDQRGIYESFIKLNTCGKPMDSSHINKVKELLTNLDDGTHKKK